MTPPVVADTESMRELNGEEREVVRRVHKREGLRRQLMDVIGESLGLVWGGRFKNKDLSHFEWTGGLSMSELKAQKCR